MRYAKRKRRQPVCPDRVSRRGLPAKIVLSPLCPSLFLPFFLPPPAHTGVPMRYLLLLFAQLTRWLCVGGSLAPFDCIIGCDILYDSSLHDPLLRLKDTYTRYVRTNTQSGSQEALDMLNCSCA